MNFKVWHEAVANLKYDVEQTLSGGFRIEARIGGMLVAYAMLRHMGDGFEMNNIQVESDFRRQGIGLELYRIAAKVARENGGTLYTSIEQTDMGRKIHNKMWRMGWFGDRIRKDGGYRSSINPK